MRVSKILFVILVLIFCFAGSDDYYQMDTGATGTAACSTPTTGDELNEGWLGAGAENTWATQGALTVDEDEVLNGSPPSGSCTEGLNLVQSANNGTRYWNRGTPIDTSATVMDFYYSFYINTMTIDSFLYVSLSLWDTDTDPGSGSLFYVRFRCNSGSTCTEATGNFQIQAYGATGSTLTTVTTGAWHELIVHINTAGTSYAQLDGGTQEAFTLTDTIDGQVWHLGSNGLIGAGEGYDIDFGYTYINTP